MKKLIFISLFFSLIVAFVACENLGENIKVAITPCSYVKIGQLDKNSGRKFEAFEAKIAANTNNGPSPIINCGFQVEGNLPPGISHYTEGRYLYFTGSPTTTGNFSFKVTVVANVANDTVCSPFTSASRNCTITISD